MSADALTRTNTRRGIRAPHLLIIIVLSVHSAQ